MNTQYGMENVGNNMGNQTKVLFVAAIPRSLFRIQRFRNSEIGTSPLLDRYAARSADYVHVFDVVILCAVWPQVLLYRPSGASARVCDAYRCLTAPARAVRALRARAAVKCMVRAGDEWGLRLGIWIFKGEALA